MDNIIQSNYIEKVYDIKGSTFNREVGSGSVLKDIDWSNNNEKLNLSRED